MSESVQKLEAQEREDWIEFWQIYHQFIRFVDQVRSYYDKDTMAELWDKIPTRIRGLAVEREVVMGIAAWVTEYMKWSDSGALPRRTDVLQVFRDGRGRCGEYANVLCGLLTACKFDARLVFDFTDHVWVEWYDSSQEVWIPLDSTLDNPVVSPYARILSGKEISYIIAFGPSKIEDVTFGYVSDDKKEEVKKRRTTPLVDMLIEIFNLGAEREDWQ